MKNIIFIEGVSGVGKSTTVHKLSDKLRSLGYSVKSHVEGDPTSPLDLCWAAYFTIPEYENLLIVYPTFAEELSKNIIYRDDYILLRYQVECTPLYSSELHAKLHKHEFCYNPVNTVPLSKFTEVFTNLWKEFAYNGVSENDYVIFDASLVGHITNDLIRNYNASEAELVEHIETLLHIIRSMNPIIFYLSSDNVCERLIKARDSRKQTPPDNGRIEFWEKRKQIDLSVLSQLSVQSQIIDITNEDWDSAISYIASQVTNTYC
ncbi:P-loop NTPase family protein [Lachnoclostridium phytofermentans]|uniref:Thymidylate kinase-like domain-containing protein n=1 Tax=Lachnoclostridium phytofermentans (strain ATCC 700394 / DSM 18823 / ISDg) TaxID=357809 RepID=A9KII6_LACP7|nr:hypothetical protein [Lachnoclostridium phytofermentans]ABX42438.1 hypothetical protein Cphy_2070 [Lachnoclostridium phytofermentans ISDg]